MFKGAERLPSAERALPKHCLSWTMWALAGHVAWSVRNAERQTETHTLEYVDKVFKGHGNSSAVESLCAHQVCVDYTVRCMAVDVRPGVARV